jgi:hypothetical protein
MPRFPRLMLACAVVMATAFVGTIAGTAAARSSAGVPTLTKLWSVRLAGPGTTPVIANDEVFVTAVKTKLRPHGRGPGSFLYAYAACAPAPTPCPKHVMWRQSFPTNVFVQQRVPTLLTPVGAGGGNVYVGSQLPLGTGYEGTEHAYSAATGASVFSEGQGGTSASAVAGGLVYSDWQAWWEPCFCSILGTEALDATTGAPLFTTESGPGTTSAPSVAGGSLFVGIDTGLLAYSASGTTNCIPSPPLSVSEFLGFPTTCSALWSASTGGTLTGTPVVAGGEVYVGASNGVLYAFPEAGCGSPTCAPDWTATIGGSITSAVAVNSTTVFVGSSNGSLDSFLVGGCGFSTCTPEWSATVGGSLSAPTVGGSLVYVDSTNGMLDVFAAAGCGNSMCTAEWQANVHRPLDNAPAVSNGVIFVTDTHYTLHVYRLP